MAVKKNTDITSEAEALHFVSIYENDLENVPVEFMTKKVCDAAFKQKPYGRTYAYIPEKHRTFAMCLKAAPDYGAETKQFADCHLRSEWGISVSAFVALKKKGTIPSMTKVKDPAIVLECYKKAFGMDVSIIAHMPKDLIPKIVKSSNVRSVLSHYNSSGRFSSNHTFKGDEFVNLVPKELMTDEVIEYFQGLIEKEFNSKSGSVSIDKIPQEYMTTELYELSVEKSAYNLNKIPADRVTQNMCEIAVKKNGSVLIDVPEQWRGKFYSDVVMSGKGLDTIPEADRTEQLCTLAVEKNAEQFEFVPDALKSYSLCLKAIDENAEMIEFIPQDKVDKELMIRFIISIFNEKYEYDWRLVDTHGNQAEKGEEPLMKTVFDNFFDSKQGSYQRKEQLRELLLEVIARDAKLYFKLLKFEGEDERDSYKYRGFKPFFEDVSRMEHTIVAAKTDIKVVSAFSPEIQEYVWKHFLDTAK